MKKKILASLLAVCLFVGMAVPAFATATSSVAGDGSKVTAMEFAKKNYEIKQDGNIDFKKELSIFESKEKLVIDYEQITWELEGQDTNFTLNGSIVEAVNASGTATLVAKDDQSNKVVAKTQVKAIPNPNRKNATSFKYKNQTDIKIPVGYNAENFDFRVLPITTGNYWTDDNAKAVSDAVIADFGSVLGLDGSIPYAAVPKTTASNFVVNIDTNTGNATSVSVPTLTFTTVDAKGKNTVTKVIGTQVPKNASAIQIANAFNSKKITVYGVTYTAKNYRTSADPTTPTAYINFVADVAGQPSASVPNNDIMQPVLSASKDLAAGNNIAVGIDNGKSADGVTETESCTNIVEYKGIDADTNELMFTIPGAALRDVAQLGDAHASLESKDYNTKKPVVSVATMTDRDGANPKTVTAKTNVSWVAAKNYSTIAVVPNKTIEVGEKFNLADTVKKGASNANVHGKLSNWTEEYYNDAALASDYAIVNNDGSEVLGVAVGKNKISVMMENGVYAYCNVTVVAKGAGTKPTEGNVSLANANPKMIVGGTYQIGLKNQPAGSKVTHSNPYNTAIATVDAGGRITAVAPGQVKIVTDVDGVKLYTTVTVTAAPAVVDPPVVDKPSTPPQTGVN